MSPGRNRNKAWRGRFDGCQCPKCGYDLTGLPGARCPECGYALEPHEVYMKRKYPGVIELPGWVGRFGRMFLAFAAAVLCWFIEESLDSSSTLSMLMHVGTRVFAGLGIFFFAHAILGSAD